MGGAAIERMTAAYWFDLGIVALFALSAIVQGWRARRKASQNMTEFFLAGRTLSGWKAGVSMAATQFAADTPMLVVGLIAVGGLYEIWRLWVYAIAFLVMGYLLSAAWRRSGVLTDAELTIVRYGDSRAVRVLRSLKAVYYGIIINCTVMAMVLTAGLRIFEIFLPWHLILPEELYMAIESHVAGLAFMHEFASGATDLSAATAGTNNFISVLVLLGFVGLYASTGGLRSVVSTDVIQFAIMMLAMAVYAGMLLQQTGGPDGMVAGLIEQYGRERTGEMLSLRPHDGVLAFWMIIGMQWLFQVNSDGTGYLAQRTMACAGDRDARRAAEIFTILQILLRSLMWIPIALGLLLLHPPDPSMTSGTPSAAWIAERETLFAVGMNLYLPVGVRGLMVAAMLAALASTVDTHLNWGAGYITNDLYKPLRRFRQPGLSSDSADVWVARLSGLGILSIALALVTVVPSIQTAWTLTLLFGAGMGAVLVLRWLWERINVYSEFAAIAVSILAAPVLLWYIDLEWQRMFYMAVLSTGAVILSVLIPVGGSSHEALLSFYHRVRPAGFWQKSARQLRMDPEEPWRLFKSGLLRIVLVATALFSVLYAILTLLFPVPD